MMDFAKRIEDLRLERNMSVYRLADKSGVLQQTIQAIKTNDDISLSTIEKLCAAFEIPVSEFFNDSGNLTLSVTPEQKELLLKWSALPEKCKRGINEIMDSAIESQR